MGFKNALYKDQFDNDDRKLKMGSENALSEIMQKKRSKDENKKLNMRKKL